MDHSINNPITPNAAHTRSAKRSSGESDCVPWLKSVLRNPKFSASPTWPKFWMRLFVRYVLARPLLPNPPYVGSLFDAIFSSQQRISYRSAENLLATSSNQALMRTWAGISAILTTLYCSPGKHNDASFCASIFKKTLPSVLPSAPSTDHSQLCCGDIFVFFFSLFLLLLPMFVSCDIYLWRG
jgi:hypothetical protein